MFWRCINTVGISRNDVSRTRMEMTGQDIAANLAGADYKRAPKRK